MSEFDKLFDDIMHAKPVGNYLPRLPVGRHLLAIKRYNGKNTDRGMGVILEADFVVLQSNTLKPGDLRGNPWFPQAPGEQGNYESARVVEFLAAVGGGVGDPRSTKMIGASLVDGTYVGVQILAEVTAALEKDGVTQKRSKKKNEPMFNISWGSVPNQTQETVSAVRTHIQTIQAPEPVAASAPVAAPQGFGGGFGQAPAVAPTAPPFGTGFGQPAPAPAQQPGATPGIAGIIANLNPNANKPPGGGFSF